MKKIALSFTLLIFIVQLIYTKGIVQKNPESLFLTDSGKESLLEYKNKYPTTSKVIAYINEAPSKSSYEKILIANKSVLKICDGQCSTLLPEELYRSKKDLLARIETSAIKPISLVTKESIGFVIFTKQGGEKIERSIINYLQKDFKLVGHSYINMLLDNSSKIVQDKIFPFVFFMSFIILLFITKSFKNAFFLFFPPLFSSVLSLSVIKFFFTTMNMVNSIVPLICFIICLSISLHLYFTAVEERSFTKSFEIKKSPIALMIITTFIGFFSLCISKMGVIREFGYLCSVLILINSIFSIYWLKLINTFFNFNIESRSLLLKYFPRKTLSLPVIIITLVISGIGGFFGAKNIKVVTDASNYFTSRPQIRESIVYSKVLTGGIPLVEIIIRDDKLSFSKFKEISKVEKEIIENLDVNIQSKLNSIRMINFDYSGNNTISDNKFSFNLLKSKIPRVLREDLDDGNYKLTVVGVPLDVDEFLELISKVKQQFKNYDISFNGLYYNLMISQKEMINTLFYSFLTSLVLMSFIVLFVFKKTHVFLSFLITNLAPVGISLMILPLIGLSLNIATVMTYSIGLGIVVDSSFHIFHSLESKNSNFEKYYLYTLRPIICSTALLFICFSVFIVYDFLPIREFGLNLALIVTLGFIFDVFVLPTLFLKKSSLLKGQS